MPSSVANRQQSYKIATAIVNKQPVNGGIISVIGIYDLLTH